MIFSKSKSWHGLFKAAAANSNDNCTYKKEIGKIDFISSNAYSYIS